jgi:hypothetical protein
MHGLLHVSCNAIVARGWMTDPGFAPSSGRGRRERSGRDVLCRADDAHDRAR